MSEWNPGQYLKFESERGKPIADLLGHVELDAPARVIDIGCGPGNSTEFLAKRWPEAEIIGLDSSRTMLEAARKRLPDLQWAECDAAGDLSRLGKFDLVFSNAALQWMPDHEQLLPRWFALLNPGGVLAVQAPHNHDSPLHRVLLARGGNKSRVAQYRPAEYYDILSELTNEFEIWTTSYHHVLNSHEDMIEWYKGTGFRPHLEKLDARGQEVFLAEMLEQVRELYPPLTDGNILFKFKRLFFTATKEGN